MPVIVVERRQTLIFLPGNREGEGSLPARVSKKRREQIIYFVGHAIELVAQTIVEGQVR